MRVCWRCRLPAEVVSSRQSRRPLLLPQPLVHGVCLRNLSKLILSILLPLLFGRLRLRESPHARFVLGDVVLLRGNLPRLLLQRLLLLLV